MTVLLDTNILVDFLAKRPQFFNNAQCIVKKCKNEEITGDGAVHTISTDLSHTTCKQPQRQTERTKNRQPAAAGRCRFCRIRQAEDIGVVHKRNPAVKLI